MRPFKVGDRVLYNACSPAYSFPRNVSAVVASEEISSGRIAIEFCESVGHGHYCDGRVPSGRGWYVDPEELTPQRQSVEVLYD